MLSDPLSNIPKATKYSQRLNILSKILKKVLNVLELLLKMAEK